MEHHSHYHTRHGEDQNKDQGHVIGGFKSWVLSFHLILFLSLGHPVPIGWIRLMIELWVTQTLRRKPRNMLGKNWRRWASIMSDSQIVGGNMTEWGFAGWLPLCRFRSIIHEWKSDDFSLVGGWMLHPAHLPRPIAFKWAVYLSSVY